MKVFIGLTEIAGYFSNLKKGFELNKINSTFLDLTNHNFNYGGNDNDLFLLVKLILKLKLIQDKTKNNSIFKIAYFTEKSLRILLFIQILFTHDVFIFSFANSFLKYKDLPILKFFNKKIIYVFLGSDSRPPYIDGFIISKISEPKYEKLYERSKKQKENISTIEKYSDYIIDHIPQALFHEKKFIPLSKIGIPFSSKYSYSENKTLKNLNSVKILHSPSNIEVKGTLLIREVIKEIKNKGYNIEFIEVVNKPNSYVIEKINECDIIIDQIYSDTPMAGFSTEAAFFGKPVVVCGYYSDYISMHVEESLIPPTIFCSFEKLEENIIRLIEDYDYRILLGNNSRYFVANVLNPSVVAEKYLNIINNNIDNSYFFDPNNIDYIYGGGIEKNNLREIIKKLVDKYGIKSLQLKDKPHLEKLFLNFIKEENNVEQIF